MKFLLLLICFITYINLYRAQTPSPPDCKKEKNGFQFPSEDYCNDFNVCIFGTTVKKNCKYGLHYDAITKTCTTPKLIKNGKCSWREMCIDNNGAKFAHSNCENFYLCNSDVPIEKECGQSLHFDYKKQVCQVPDKIDGPCNFVDLCKNEKEGKMLSHKDETKFYICMDGEAVLMSCDSGLVFNKAKEFCEAKGTPKDFVFSCK